MNPSDVKFEPYVLDRMGRRTGQGVRATHVPTGEFVICTEEETREQNEQRAVELLKRFVDHGQ